MSDDLIDRNDPGIVIDARTGRLSYRGEPYTGAVEQVRPDGTWIEYWSYDNGDRDGDWSGWYADGTQRYNGQFYRNRAVGTWQEWYPDGRLRRVDVYDIDGRPVSSSVWDSSGELIEFADERTDKGIGQEAVDASDPAVRVDPVTDRTTYDGAPFTGQLIRRPAPSAPITEVTTYSEGRPHGRSRGWYISGSDSFDGEYADGRETGTWREWFPDGRPKSETVLSVNGALRSRKVWDERGMLVVDEQ
ncbi:hypothetical protein [Nocardia sp. NPDC005366]|uniref:toxin-antitoxin system YwqK family antitoxin n=1 Tax=Nocardia sp. NPDC005366 TaxID=3156878 RepID=UPI00339E12B7